MCNFVSGMPATFLKVFLSSYPDTCAEFLELGDLLFAEFGTSTERFSCLMDSPDIFKCFGDYIWSAEKKEPSSDISYKSL